MEEWSEIYQTYVDHVHRFLMYYLGNHEDAEDMTQETFIRAFTKWEQFGKKASLKTWLISIARNLAVDRGRKKQRWKLLQPWVGQETKEVPLPEEMLRQDETRRELYAAIQSLKPDYRAIVILKGIQEYTNAEAAEALGWSESKAKVTYHRAIKSLGGKLKMEGNIYGMA